jgi:peptidoglycan-associated lipoprotein
MESARSRILGVVTASLLVLFVAACAKERVTTDAWPGSSGVGGHSGVAGSDEAGRFAGSAGDGTGSGRFGWDASGAAGQSGRGSADSFAGRDGADGHGGVGGEGGRAGGAGGRASGQGSDLAGSQHGENSAGAGQGGTESLAARVGAARPDPRQFTATGELEDIHFDFDRYEIRSEDVHTLQANAEWIRSRPNDLVLIEGHCDERGTYEYNLALAQHRAESAKNFLVSQGVPASRIAVISYGELRPLCGEASETCWAQNRRAHFLIKSR